MLNLHLIFGKSKKKKEKKGRFELDPFEPLHLEQTLGFMNLCPCANLKGFTKKLELPTMVVRTWLFSLLPLFFSFFLFLLLHSFLPCFFFSFLFLLLCPQAIIAHCNSSFSSIVCCFQLQFQQTRQTWQRSSFPNRFLLPCSSHSCITNNDVAPFFLGKLTTMVR